MQSGKTTLDRGPDDNLPKERSDPRARPDGPSSLHPASPALSSHCPGSPRGPYFRRAWGVGAAGGPCRPVFLVQNDRRGRTSPGPDEAAATRGVTDRTLNPRPFPSDLPFVSGGAQGVPSGEGEVEGVTDSASPHKGDTTVGPAPPRQDRTPARSRGDGRTREPRPHTGPAP